MNLSNEWRVKIWLLPVPFMAMIAGIVSIWCYKYFEFNSFWAFLIMGGLSTLLMFPFMLKYGEMYRKLDW